MGFGGAAKKKVGQCELRLRGEVFCRGYAIVSIFYRFDTLKWDIVCRLILKEDQRGFEGLIVWVLETIATRSAQINLGEFEE